MPNNPMKISELQERTFFGIGGFSVQRKFPQGAGRRKNIGSTQDIGWKVSRQIKALDYVIASFHSSIFFYLCTTKKLSTTGIREPRFALSQKKVFVSCFTTISSKID